MRETPYAHTTRNIDDLIPYLNNARTHSQEQIKTIAASIQEFGFTSPILIDESNGVIAGHGRIEAAAKLKELPCIVIDGLTETQKKALVIADNSLALNAGWDMEKLSLELKTLEEMTFDIDLLAFDSETLQALSDLDADAQENDGSDDVPDVDEEEIVSRYGDLWRCGEHLVLCGDATNKEDLEKLLEGELPDMVFTDPPYGISVVSESGKLGGNSKHYRRIIGDDSIASAQKHYQLCRAIGINNYVIWGGNYMTGFLPPSRCWLVWDKEMTGHFSEAEMAWTSFKKGGVRVFKVMWNGMQREGNRKDELRKRVHPTQKPVTLFHDIFKRFDYIQTVLDCFLGSGSTLIASEKAGKTCYGMEMDPYYVDIILRRYHEYTGVMPTLAGSSMPYDKVQEERCHVC